MPEMKVSARRLVEFTHFPPDIVPTSAAAMELGMLGHVARQKDAGGKSESRLEWSGVCEGMSVTVTGRMDVYDDSADPPLIEEIKLASTQYPAPDTPLPAHRAQAVCYAHMLCAREGFARVMIRVSYVTVQGEVLADFPEIIPAERAEAEFTALLIPLARWEAALAAFRDVRDASIKALPFPYPAYRPGQREMAVQAYTAISQKKRLFCTLPTGTGKSSAALFPAVKALGEGKTDRIYYLTARTTARQGALDALSRMRERGGLRLRSVTLCAKEKQCPLAKTTGMRCHPDFCDRARGHYLRQPEALADMLTFDDWNADAVLHMAEKHCICPFEFALALCEIADVIICDYNYVFDPVVLVKRMAGKSGTTLLVDEAHNLPARARDMLSGVLEGTRMAALRRDCGKTLGRKSDLYKALTRVISALRGIESTLTDDISSAAEALLTPLAAGSRVPGASEAFKLLFVFLMAMRRYSEAPEDYKLLCERKGKERDIKLLCLNITDHLAQTTKRMRGCVYFSATLSPLVSMKTLLGGGADDACFALPSPFPEERLLVLRRSLDTRYKARERSAGEVAASILAMTSAKAGKYIAFFPSYAYLDMVREQIVSLAPDARVEAQARSMTEDDRDAFLARFSEEPGALLCLCVLGGVFAEWRVHRGRGAADGLGGARGAARALRADAGRRLCLRLPLPRHAQGVAGGGARHSLGDGRGRCAAAGQPVHHVRIRGAAARAFSPAARLKRRGDRAQDAGILPYLW